VAPKAVKAAPAVAPHSIDKRRALRPAFHEMRVTKNQFAGNDERSTPPPTVPGGLRYWRVVPVTVSVTVTVYSTSVMPPK